MTEYSEDGTVVFHEITPERYLDLLDQSGHTSEVLHTYLGDGIDAYLVRCHSCGDYSGVTIEREDEVGSPHPIVKVDEGYIGQKVTETTTTVTTTKVTEPQWVDSCGIGDCTESN